MPEVVRTENTARRRRGTPERWRSAAGPRSRPGTGEPCVAILARRERRLERVSELVGELDPECRPRLLRRSSQAHTTVALVVVAHRERVDRADAGS